MNAAEKLEVNMQKNNHEVRISLLEQAMINLTGSVLRIEKSVERIDAKIDQLSEKFDIKIDKLESKFEKRFEKVDQRMDRLENKLDHNNKWLVTMLFSLFFSAASLGAALYNIFSS